VFVGEASGEWSDQGSSCADYSEGAGDTCAEAVVAVQQKGQSGPEATEGAEDEGAD
jgi:hypothetical protein